MDVERLNSSPAGDLVPLRGHDARHGPFAYFAFLPRPLPDDLTLSSATWTTVTEAATGLGKLDQACAQLPDPGLLIRPALWREALDTSALEGTVAPLQDLLEAQLPNAQFLSPEALEVSAYAEMALQAFRIIRQRPISISLLADLQAELFRHSKDRVRDLGQVRDDPVWIGSRQRSIYEARFVPPPGDDRLRVGLDLWEKWVQDWHRHLPPVLQAALAHYQFETLHPFNDGNGRIGRLVVVLQFLRTGGLREPAITVSPALLKRRDEYQDRLLELSYTGDWDPWVQFFCRAITEQTEALIQGASALRDWLETSRQLVNARRWTGKIHEVLQDLIQWPVLTVASTAGSYHTSVGNATRMIEHLVEVGILEELTGRSYARVFGCRAVMAIVEAI